jgi:hypothetical protein
MGTSLEAGQIVMEDSDMEQPFKLAGTGKDWRVNELQETSHTGSQWQIARLLHGI